MKQKIALCIITEGDEKLKNLQLLYESISPYVDRIYLTANSNKVEKTKAWCHELGIEYSYLKWDDDFATQRNFNFSQVGDDIDYIIWADSDDVILGGEYIPRIVQVMEDKGYQSMFFQYWYGVKFDGEPHPKNFKEVELTQMRERIFRKDAIYWKGRIHETPIPVNGEDHKYTKVEYSKKPQPEKGKYPIAWLHLGADRDIPKDILKIRMDRNQRILEKQLADERKEGQADPRTLLYLMKIYAESHDAKLLEECISMGDEYMSKSGWDAERAVCTSLMARCMGELGDHKKAAEFLHQAIQEYPHDPLLYLHLARAYYNLKNYRSMRHWMRIGISLDLDEAQTSMNNLLEMKILTSELMLKYYLESEKDVEKAYDSAKKLYELNPTENNKKNEEYLYDLKELNIASGHIHKYLKYLDDIGEEDKIVQTIEQMPSGMRKLPFANSLYFKYKEPRVWGENEICYFANFGQAHFEKWDDTSLEKGIGGSETAVIRLSQEWAKLGYKVTVFGDPKQIGERDGVTYLPWYMFNKKDKFNIFIQWRSGHLAGKISTKKFYIDLHDVWYEYDYLDRIDHIDKIFVKSEYHKSFGKSLPQDKFVVISNGI